MSENINEEESISTIKLSSEMMRLLGRRLLLGDAAKSQENSSDSKLVDDFAFMLLKSAEKLDADKLALKKYDEYLKGDGSKN